MRTALLLIRKNILHQLKEKKIKKEMTHTNLVMPSTRAKVSQSHSLTTHRKQPSTQQNLVHLFTAWIPKHASICADISADRAGHVNYGIQLQTEIKG